MLNLKGSFDKKLKAMTGIGALLVCTASSLATHQFLTKYWLVLFYMGCTIVVGGTGISIVRNLMKRHGYVSADPVEKEKRESLNPYDFEGKRLKG